jgi:hypothetical protein
MSEQMLESRNFSRVSSAIRSISISCSAFDRLSQSCSGDLSLSGGSAAGACGPSSVLWVVFGRAEPAGVFVGSVDHEGLLYLIFSQVGEPR